VTQRAADGAYDQALTFNAENKVQRVTEGGEETCHGRILHPFHDRG
jgi:hypothetical protein